MEKITEFRQKAYCDFVPLKDAVPLDTPFSMMIDPSSVCNFRCQFCPTGHPALLKKANRKAGLMKPDLFKKIVDDLTGFPQKIRKLNLYKLGEPLMNEHLEDFIAYTRSKQVANVVSVTTNASLLGRERAIRLLESGLDHIRISVEHISDAGYREITRTYSDYNQILKNAAFLWNEKLRRGSHLSVSIKIVDVGLTSNEKKTFYNDFSGISDTINIETLMGWDGGGGYDFRLGRRPDRGIDNISPIRKNRQICPQPFYTLAIHHNGYASPCPVDWRINLFLGDVNKNSVVEIWDGSKLKDLRLMHLRSRRFDIDPCAACPSVEGDRLHADLDESASALVRKFSEQKTVQIEKRQAP